MSEVGGTGKKVGATGTVAVPVMKYGIITLAVLFILSCKEVNTSKGNYILPSQIIRDFQLNESVSGKRFYSLNARVAIVWENESRIDVETLEVVFYDEADQTYSRLTADEGTVWMKTEDLVSRGNVVVETSDSSVLKTDSLAWSNSRRIIHTEADVTIESPKGVIVGRGLIADAQLSKIEIKSEVRGSSNYEFQP